MDDNFKFSLVGVDKMPFLGYASSIDKTKAAPNVMVRGSQNVYKKNSGNIAVRPGLKRRGTALSTVQGIASSDEWYTSLGATRVLRVKAVTSAGGDGKLQVESDIADGETLVWYDLVASLSLTRFVFDTWWDNTEKKDKLLFVYGNTDMHMWSGGITLAAATSGGATTLVKSSTSTTFAQDGFSSTSGQRKFIINGSTTEYTYTAGYDGTTLTGITPALPDIAAGTVILQSVITTSNSPASTFTADFLKTIGNRVHVGSYTSRLIYISSNASYTDYSVPTPRTAGTPELLTLDDASKGISVRQGNAHISAGLSNWYEVSYSQVTVGSVLTEATKVDKKPTSDLSAALGHEFIDVVGDNIIYLAQDHQVRSFGTFRNLFSAKYPSLSEDIREEMSAEDFTGGHLRSVGDFIYVTAPISGYAYLHQTREKVDVLGNVTAERFWHPPQIWNVSRIAVIDGIEYGHSNQNPQIYQLWDTNQWHDDSPSDTPVPYDCVMRLAYRNHARRWGMINFNKAYYEGYVLTNAPVSSRIYYDYEGATQIIDKVLNDVDDPATIFSSEGRFGLGSAPLGDKLLGGGEIADDGDQHLPKFRVITGLSQVDCFEYDVEVHSEEADSNWEIICLGTNAQLSTAQATFIQK